MVNSRQITDLASIDSIYRAAFPAYKVFIYGKEISSDIMSVRVNQSGGSLERTPGTCQITLANQLEKYTITHEDMIYIGAYKTSEIEGVSIEEVLRSYSPDAFGFEYANPILGGPKFDEQGNLLIDFTSSKIGKPSGFPTKLPLESLNELVARILASSSDEEIKYTLEASGYQDLDLESANSIANQIVSAKRSLDSSFVSNKEFFGDNFTESSLGYNIKRELIEDKLQYIQNASPTEKENPVFNQLEGKLFNYPMQEGDLIFNLNDPVRIAFRDPFDPRRWYWMFTGFVDSWTESTGSNLDSTITITCTDVTKAARYAITNISPGLVDVNLDSLLSAINSIGNSDVKQIDINAQKEIFEGLSVIEILELIFFGSISAKDAVRQAAYYRNVLELSEATDLETLGLIAINTLGVSAEELEKDLYNKSTNKVVTFEEAQQKLLKYARSSADVDTKQTERFDSLRWSGISSPAPFSIAEVSSGIPFKRRNTSFGVNYYIYGEAESGVDSSYEAIKVKDFNEWNEILHHRVKKSDLDELSIDGVSLANPANYSLEQIIDIIGNDIKTYPVGYGSVYYLTPAGLTEKLGSDMIEKGYGGVDSFHSIFKDRLTMLYDLATELEWRFYATPKGDVVFEHPFYDIGPEQFFETKELESNLTDTNKKIINSYDDIFARAYDGTYSDVEDLTNMVFTLNTENQDLIDFMEEPEFSYKREFTVGIDEQISFSNTNTDKGIATVSRVKAHLFEGYQGLDVEAARTYVYEPDYSLVPTLGFRLIDEGVKVYIAQAGSGARAYAALKLMQRNSEARSLGLETIPKFGLMVNRPLLWQYRGYYCNIVSCSHSISWNSDITTSINTNQIRAWSGRFDGQGKPKYHHFGANDKPFSWENMIVRPNNDKKNRKTGV